MRKHASRPFTLIEMIAVMGVIILLSAVAIPAYSSLFSGRKTTLAASQLNAAVMEARAHAVSAKVYTALVFVLEKDGKGYKSFRMAEVTKGSGTRSFNWRRWVPDTALEFLPDNTMIPKTNADIGITTKGEEATAGSSTLPTVSTLPSGFLYSGNSSNAIVFHPNGQLAGTVNNNIVVRFVEANRYEAMNGSGTPRLPLNISWLTCKAKFMEPVTK